MNLVKYHNDVNKIKMGTLTERELDLFFSIIFKMKAQKSRSITLEFKELKQLSEAKERSNDRLIKSIDGMTDKILALNTKFILQNGDIEKLNLFEKIRISPSKSEIAIKTTESFSYMLNDFMEGYTRFDLKQLIGLNSSYSKQAFRILKQWDGINKECWYLIEIEEFKERLGIKKDYATKNLNTWVIKPIKEELSQYFNNFEITKLTKNKEEATRGKKAHWLKFTWNTFETKTIEKKEKKINEKEYQEAEIIESINLEQAILKAKRNIYVSKSWNKRVDNKLLKLLKDTGEEFTINLLVELYINLKQEVKTSLVQYINGIIKNMELDQEDKQAKQNKRVESVKPNAEVLEVVRKPIEEPKQEVKSYTEDEIRKAILKACELEGLKESFLISLRKKSEIIFINTIKKYIAEPQEV